MKLKTVFRIIIIFTLTITCGNLYGQQRSQKRGISENNFSDPAEILALAPGVSWFYTWGQTPIKELESVIGTEEGMEFVPMAWGKSFSEETLREYYTNNPNAKYLLGFNEPNFIKQANMTPREVAELWPVLEKIAEDFDLELVGPALNYSPDEPYINPADWLDEFLDIYPEARMDYIALHCYMIQTAAQMNFINNMAERYNRKVWLTEFCAWDGLAQGTGGYETQRRQMSQKIEDLEYSPNVAKYAWFKAKDGINKYPYYRLMHYRTEPVAEGKPGVLTEMGEIYVNMTTFDPDVYHTIDEMIPATEYIKSKNSSLELSSDPRSDFKLQWENFGASSSMSFLMDVPVAGTYYLCIRMASEEKIYAPKIEFYSDDKLLLTKEFDVTGSVNKWDTKFVELDLPAGKQTLTLLSKQNTTCKINWISLRSDITGIDRSTFSSTPLQLYRQGDELVIESENVMDRIEMLTINGQSLKSVSGQNTINVSDVNPGIYIVRAWRADGIVITHKYIL